MILIYDGDCGFCTSTAAWIRNRVPNHVRVEPFQKLALSDFGITTRQASASAWWIDDLNNRSCEHVAIGNALVAIGGSWARLGRLLRVPPISWLARPAYRLVARYRHRLGGGDGDCAIQ